MGREIEQADKEVSYSRDVATLNTSHLIDTLSKSYMAFIKKNFISKHPSVFLQGHPGVGKSASIISIARRIESETNKKVVITDIRLLMFNPVDLRGIPIADKDKHTAVWLKPEIFDLSCSDDVVNILFLDELTSAPQSLQAAAYQIALDRKLGEHTLPSNTFVIAAGNYQDDFSVTYAMPSALKNRFMHFDIKTDVDAWLVWARENSINPIIINFIERHPDLLSTQDFNPDKPIIVTPRSWEMLSVLLNALDDETDKLEIMIAGVVGRSLAKMILNDIQAPYNIQDVIDGKTKDVPESISDIQYVTKVLEQKIDYFIEDEQKIKNILSFILNLPVDYGLRIFKKILHYEIESYKVEQLDVFKEYMNRLSTYDDAS